MAGRGLDDLINKLDYVDKNLARDMKPRINNLFRESVHNALSSYYMDYDPTKYKATSNFLFGVDKSSKTEVSGKYLIMSVSSEYMRDYPGWFKQELPSEWAFDMFWKQGEHGHGKILMAISSPTPSQLVTNDIKNKFNGEVGKVMRTVLGIIFR